MTKEPGARTARGIEALGDGVEPSKGRSNPMRSAALIFTALAGGVVILPGGATGQDASVTDSAGVRIVTSPVGDVGYARMAEDAALSIGLAEGPEEFLFERIVSVARDEDANLVVADAGWFQIRVFDAAGDHVRTMGGQGEGPGDFAALGGAWPRAGGGVIAVDSFLQRVSKYGPTGELERVAKLRDAGSPLTFRSWGLAGPESLLGSVTHPSSPGLARGETARSPVNLVRHGLDGAIIDTVSRFPGEAGGVAAADGAVFHMMSLPFSAAPAAAGSADAVATTGGETYEILLFDLGGSLRRIARLAVPPPGRTGEHLMAVVPDDRMRALYEQLPLPAALPGYVKLVFADTGELWAQRYLAPGTPLSRWDVFHPDGQYLGRVEIPASFRLHAVSDGQLLGVQKDELEVERVQVRDLIRDGAQQPL